ncbi:uncharacterized protein LOC135485468 isoform X2 [Lineus longissimus]|uniref:uncharacterized protein LOC135485468 isoform X2 n=1 Tax=Lineus longissimus TaxID=88925 RepID=UPI00315E0046
MSAHIGVTNRAFDGEVEETGHSLSKDSGIADLADIIPELPPKKSPRPTPKVFVKNPSAHKYENQCPLPTGAGSANSTSKKRPDNLAIPSHISSTKNNRPASSVHDYEELPLAKTSKSQPRLKKFSHSDDRYTPSPPPMPPLSSLPSTFDIYSQTGSDVSIISEGPRKRQNPLYDSAKAISQPDHSDSKNGSNCLSKNRALWIILIVIGILTILLFILLVLVIIGALGVKKTQFTSEPQVDNGARNKTIQLEAALEAALKRVNDLESKVVELDTVLSFIGNTSHNSTLLTRFDEVVKNTSSNTAAVSGLDTRVTENTNQIILVDSKVDQFREEALQNNRGVSDKINQLITNKINPMIKSVDTIKTQITSLNDTIHGTLMPELQTLKDDFVRLNSTALTDCKLNTTIHESFSTVHDELDTPYVEESAEFVFVGVACSTVGFSYTSRNAIEIEPGSDKLKYRCQCRNLKQGAKKIQCGIHVLMCSTDPMY